MGDKAATRFGFYQGLCELAKEKEDIYALDADLAKTLALWHSRRLFLKDTSMWGLLSRI